MTLLVLSKLDVDMDKVSTYPSVSIPLCCADGAQRETAKSKLFEAAMSDMHNQAILQKYSLDLAASCDTYSE